MSSQNLSSVSNKPAVFIAAFGLIAGVAFLVNAFDVRQGGLFLIGGLLGATLYHASFGFTWSWRVFILERRGAELIRAQILMLALATLAFLPLLDAGAPLGRSLVGAIGPVGISVFVGAFVFGIGMQLGGGCGSGTLFTVGGGSQRMLVTLLFFILGSLLGTLHLPWWIELPSLGPLSLSREIGLMPTIVLQLVAFSLLGWITIVLERRRHGRVLVGLTARHSGEPVAHRFLRGPWPFVWGAMILAALNIATLLLAGHPWSVTFGFGLWGAKVFTALGVDVASWEFWTWRYPAKALAGSVLADTTSVMNFGLILGAMLAAALANRFAPAMKLPLLSLLAAAIGGVLLGYGARLAFGCNIGAMFSGIASGSVHGWLWLVMAFLGNIIGVRIRTLFGLAN